MLSATDAKGKQLGDRCHYCGFALRGEPWPDEVRRMLHENADMANCELYMRHDPHTLCAAIESWARANARTQKAGWLTKPIRLGGGEYQVMRGSALWLAMLLDRALTAARADAAPKRAAAKPSRLRRVA